MREGVLARWDALDAARALHDTDRDVLRQTASIRALVVEHATMAAAGRDLFNACASLGRAYAAREASPTLAAVTLDGAASALLDAGVRLEPAEMAAAKSAFTEGYVAATVDREKAVARAALAYPATVVDIGDGVVAIAAVHPVDEPEALRTWAGEVAARVARAGARRAFVGGAPAAKEALEDALATVGVEIAERLGVLDVLRVAFGRRDRRD